MNGKWAILVCTLDVQAHLTGLSHHASTTTAVPTYFAAIIAEMSQLQGLMAAVAEKRPVCFCIMLRSDCVNTNSSSLSWQPLCSGIQKRSQGIPEVLLVIAAHPRHICMYVHVDTCTRVFLYTHTHFCTVYIWVTDVSVMHIRRYTGPSPS